MIQILFIKQFDNGVIGCKYIDFLSKKVEVMSIHKDNIIVSQVGMIK